MPQLTLTCQSCGKPIENGHLGIDTSALAAFREEMEKWQAAHQDGADLMDLVIGGPELVQWATHCAGCEPNTCGYSIHVSEVRSYRDLVRWTAHLMAKGWLSDTDWRQLLENVVAGTDRRIREVAK